MEAATPLPFAQVRVRHGRLLVETLVVEDEVAVRLAGERPDPARFVLEAVEIGARVLDREATGANADFVRSEFEKAARELKDEFTVRAKGVADRLDEKVDEVFGPDHGHVTLALARHFGDDSSAAVQHKVRAALTEVAGQMREDLRTQLTSDTDANPIMAIQKASLGVMKQSADQQASHLRAMADKLEAMKVEVAELRAEKEGAVAVAAAEQKGTAKGRSYEEAVAEALDAIAHAQGDDCDAVGDVPGVGGKKGDVVVAIDACAGPARGRVVFEAKNSKLSKKSALAELDDAMATRGADYGVFVVPGEDRLPARTQMLREFNGDKLFVVFDPDGGSRLALEVAYTLARARVLMARGEGDGVDTATLGAEVERALGAMDDARRVKQQLTHASNGISEARSILEAMEAGVRAHLAGIQGILDAAGEPGDG